MNYEEFWRRDEAKTPQFTAFGRRAESFLGITAKMLLAAAMAIVFIAMLAGCSLHDVQYPFAIPSEPVEIPQETVVNIGEKDDEKKITVDREATTTTADNRAVGDRVFNIDPPVITPKPIIAETIELKNVNRYARALEEKLLQRYNNTPQFAGKIGKVQMLPVREPKVSLNGDKMKIEWSQIVFDIWGDRVPELEKEFYVVTFGDGKPLLQRTRPSITVGLNNEGGHGEFAAVRGGIFSERDSAGSPQMFDRPDSERNLLLDEEIDGRNAVPDASDFYDLPEIRQILRENPREKESAPPIIAPAKENLTALVVE